MATFQGYKLNASIEAWKRINEQFGSLKTAINELKVGNYWAIIIFLWSFMADNEPTITPEKVARMLNTYNVVTTANAIGQAIDKSHNKELNNLIGFIKH
ncbi:hypothetical protein Psch_02199 [Pelotomaculum schinkii]|uniref:Uncharacterized protein n=1 Tax=Pelotomaculum schinkii TaxID=78350 RepID=A0A4Y7RIJ5_9FIRM|nr:hypothetical protein [Pelotomaculum schinkii]TEB08633.1 hypothetical protein Psch_02199 [Pelotomaculum schinkii]